MNYKKLRQPIGINERNWFYADGQNFIFVHEVVDKDGNYIQTDSFEVKVDLLSDIICKL